MNGAPECVQITRDARTNPSICSRQKLPSPNRLRSSSTACQVGCPGCTLDALNLNGCPAPCQALHSKGNLSKELLEADPDSHASKSASRVPIPARGQVDTYCKVVVLEVADWTCMSCLRKRFTILQDSLREWLTSHMHHRLFGRGFRRSEPIRVMWATHVRVVP